MTRPASFRACVHERQCGTCEFSHVLAYKLHLLCFRGDDIKVTKKEQDIVYMDGIQINAMWGEVYNDILQDRVVETDNICDEWRRR